MWRVPSSVKLTKRDAKEQGLGCSVPSWSEIWRGKERLLKEKLHESVIPQGHACTFGKHSSLETDEVHHIKEESLARLMKNINGKVRQG